jgi:mannose-6-phosphate isomerase-like protein (cupin superfamily)
MTPLRIPPFDPGALGPQFTPRTAKQFARFMDWPAGQQGDEPERAAERLYLVVEGTLMLRAAGAEHAVAAGRIGWVPPGAPVSLRAAQIARCRFWSVLAPNQLSTSPLTAAKGAPTVIDAAPGAILPTARSMRAEILELHPGERTSRQILPEQERLYYVLHGAATASVKYLSGVIGPHRILHVPQEYPHQLTAQGNDDFIALCLTFPAL